MATTEQLMAQYGIAWFGFDEISGNAYDKLGLNNYIGTVTGATRVQGWDSIGNALNFNGTNQYVAMNSPIIPMGEKTIRFKVKRTTHTTHQLILSNSLWITNTFGIDFSILSTGELMVTPRNGDNTGMSHSIMYTFLELEKWSDIVYSFSNIVGDYAKLYVNGKLVLTSLITLKESGTASANLTLGKSNHAVTMYYSKSPMDELQVYNKALTIHDFEQRRLVHNIGGKGIAILDNKVIQLPNTNEPTILQQGKVINEIDFAVDKQPLDLTVSINKYEVASNSQSPSGMNKIFTILTEKEFKTIEVEDNY